jgi:hypothetical protein
MRAALFQPLDDLEQMADGAGEPVEADDDEDVAGGNVAYQLRQHRTRTRGTGAVLP